MSIRLTKGVGVSVASTALFQASMKSPALRRLCRVKLKVLISEHQEQSTRPAHKGGRVPG